MKILLADDDVFYRSLLESSLEQWGHEVVSAENGKQAWELLQKPGAPGIAIIDWMMPEMDGVELCHLIRSSPTHKGMYVILVTVRDEKQDTVLALENGADDYLTKPMDLEELRARIRAGERIVDLQKQLLDNVIELEVALTGGQKLESLGRLAGGVAHDFNNLLQIIGSASDLLQPAFTEGPQADCLQLIRDAASRGSSLTRQLLAFSRNQIIAPQILHLNSLIQNLEKMLRRLLHDNIQFHLDLSPSLGLMEADPGQIEQIVMNLVVNARDAMTNGGNLTISTRMQESKESRLIGGTATGEIILSVEDDGCGMDEETLPQIFEPFFTTKPSGEGTGLGLATVYGIVRQANGSLQVRSRPGEGTVFQIGFPASTKSSVAAAARPSGIMKRGSAETILVAEDDSSVRKLVVHTLRSNEYTVIEAQDGEDALEVSRRHNQPIDLLLTDVCMPHVNGPELNERLRQLIPALKVIFMSGNPDDSLVQEQVGSGGAPFLAKPFSSKELTQTVRNALDS